MDPETLELLHQQDWAAIGKEMVSFAVFRARSYHWRRGGSWELAAGETVEDVVQKVVLKTIEGTRNWDPEKGPLVPWLIDQVKSEIDHLCRSCIHKHEAPIPESEDGEQLIDLYADQASEWNALSATFPQDPEEVFLKKEETQRREAALFQATDGDPELEEVLDAVANCGPKPRHLAVEMGVPVEDVYNRLRRLRRRAQKLLEGENS